MIFVTMRLKESKVAKSRNRRIISNTNCKSGRGRSSNTGITAIVTCIVCLAIALCNLRSSFLVTSEINNNDKFNFLDVVTKKSSAVYYSSLSSSHRPRSFPGQKLYIHSLYFLRRLFMELGLEEWKKYLGVDRKKRFDKNAQESILFTRKIFKIAAEVLLTTATGTTTDNSATGSTILLPPPPPPLNDAVLKFNDDAINCSDTDYFKAFTGRLDPNGDKIIVDWIPIGWDANDMTEIRLAEYGDLIDKFVMFDIDVTLKAVPKPILMPQLLRSRFRNLYSDKIDYQLLRNFMNDTFPDGLPKKFRGYPVETLLRNRGWEYVKQLYRNQLQTSHRNLTDDRIFIIQNDGDEIMTRKSILHLMKCEWKKPEQVIFAPAVNYKTNLAWVEHRSPRMAIYQLLEKQKKYIQMTRFNWLKGPTIRKLYPSNPNNDELDFRMRGTFKLRESERIPHLGLGSAVHLSSPGVPMSAILKSMSTADDPHGLKEFDTAFMEKAMNGSLTYLELRRISFKCQNTGQSMFKNVIDAFNKTTFNYAVSTLPWIVRSMPERYPWLTYNNMYQKELKVKECVCSEDWRIKIAENPDCLELQKNPWT